MLGHLLRQSGARRLVALVLCPWALATAAQAQATTKPPGGIYTCIDDKGRRLTADRPIAECTDREQQVLNRDGSLRTVLPPTLTAEERAQREARVEKMFADSADRMRSMEEEFHANCARMHAEHAARIAARRG